MFQFPFHLLLLLKEKLQKKDSEYKEQANNHDQVSQSKVCFTYLCLDFFSTPFFKNHFSFHLLP